MADTIVSKSPQKPFDVKEVVRYRLEEELEKVKDSLGEDYEALRDFARRIYITRQPGTVVFCYEDEDRSEHRAIDEASFPQVIGPTIEAYLYKSGLASKLESVDRARELIARALFKAKKELEIEWLYSLKNLPFDERVKYIVKNIEGLLNDVVKASSEREEGGDFKELGLRAQARAVAELIIEAFDVVRVDPRDRDKLPPSYYVADDDVLYDVEYVVTPICGALVLRGLASKSLKGEVELAIKSTDNVAEWHQVDPWNMLRLRNGVLDLEKLKFTSKRGLYFRHRLSVSLSEGELEEIKCGSYDVRENAIYKYWRPRFDDTNWEYLVDALGAILAPFRFKLIAFIVGPSGAGKSTLLSNLRRPIDPIVASVSLRSVTDYTFGLEPLIGKQIIMYSERGETVLRNLDIINNLFGESDIIPVQRKHKPAVEIPSLKAGYFAMNDVPLISEYGGETFGAFFNRLSIIQMSLPEGAVNERGLQVDQNEAFKFLLWCRCRLEERGWEMRKMDVGDMLDFVMRASNSALQFLESDWVEKDPSAKVRGTELYDAYVRWCLRRELPPMGRDKFYTMVASKYVKRLEKGVTWFRGIALSAEALGSASLSDG